MSRTVKSKERVRKHAEVYTPIHIVQKMVDLLEQEESGVDVWAIGKTWLEPSCGNGVFIGEIVRRKLSRCLDAKSAIAALKDVYAVDILPDNVQQARCQALGQLVFWALNQRISCDFGEALMVIETNIVCGDFLKPETVMIYDWKTHETHSLKSMMDEEDGTEHHQKKSARKRAD